MCFVPDADTAVLSPAGNLLVSGIVAELDQVHAAGLLQLGAASLPDEAFLAALQRLAAAKPPRPPQLTAQPRKPQSVKAARVRLASLATVLRGWDLSYRTAPSVLPDHSSRLHGSSLQVLHRLALNSAGAELVLPEKTVTAHIAELAVSQEQQQHAAVETSTGGSSAAAAEEARVCQLLHVASVSAGVLPPGHAALRQPTAEGQAHAGSTGSVEAGGGATASSKSSPAAGPAIDLHVSGISVQFEPDVAFGAIDTIGELAGIAEEAKQQLPQHWQQRLSQHTGQKAAKDSPAPDQQKAGAKLCMALRLHNLAANVALTPDVCFAIKVSKDCSGDGLLAIGSIRRFFSCEGIASTAITFCHLLHAQVGAVEHHLGSLAASVSALAVQLNGQDVATVLQLRAAAQMSGASGASARSSLPKASSTSSPAALKLSAAKGVSSISSANMAVASRSRPSLTIQLPNGAEGGGAGDATAALPPPAAPAVQPLAMPYENDAPQLARARAAAGVLDDSSSPVFAPAVVVTAAVAGARILLPHGCELGTAVRGTELWAKAFSQVGSQV